MQQSEIIMRIIMALSFYGIAFLLFTYFPNKPIKWFITMTFVMIFTVWGYFDINPNSFMGYFHRGWFLLLMSPVYLGLLSSSLRVFCRPWLSKPILLILTLGLFLVTPIYATYDIYKFRASKAQAMP